METATIIPAQRTGISFWWYVLALLLPIAGFIGGIVCFAKSQVGPGLAMWATSFLGWMLAVVLLLGA